MEKRQPPGRGDGMDGNGPVHGPAPALPSLHADDYWSVNRKTRPDGTPLVSADVSTNTEMPADLKRTETTVTALHDRQPERAARLQRAIYLLFGILDALLILRLALPLLGANPAAGFARFVQAITAPFMAPFAELFSTPLLNTLVAILVFTLIAWMLGRVVWLVMGDMRRGVGSRTIGVKSHSDDPWAEA